MYKIASLRVKEKEGYKIKSLPFSIRILLENVIRNYDNYAITDEHMNTLLNWDPRGTNKEVPYKPARVLMQDFTGVPAVVDIASIRSEVVRKGMDGSKINPAIPVDLIVDHSVQVDYFGSRDAYEQNVGQEYHRNAERYKLLKWAQKAFNNFTVVPPGMGICHQVNLEYLASGVIEREGWVFPDTLVGTDSHTPMVNGIGVLGWGVGGIEAEAALLGQPIYFTCPQVIGLKLTGKLPQGVTATDMVLAITHELREFGVVGKFVEVFGNGLDHLTVPDRATIANMSPEFGCTVTYFPIDDQTLDYMNRTNRPEKQIEMVREYCRKNLLWRENEEKINYSHVLEIDLNTLEPSVSGPKRPQDNIPVKDLNNKFKEILESEYKRTYVSPGERTETGHKANELNTVHIKTNNKDYLLSDGAIAIAAITSCTNTSNPSVMVGAGLIAKKAVEKGLWVKPWVKTSLAPGSKVVTEYLQRSGLLHYLEELNFHTVGYGCTTCIGNSGPLIPEVEEAVVNKNIIVSSVLSGNRNFEARVHPLVKMNFLASPILVVAYAIAGRTDIDFINEPLGLDSMGNDVFLNDIWPLQEEINLMINQTIQKKDFEKAYSVIFDGEEQWQRLEVPKSMNYVWDNNSTYIKEAPFFKDISKVPEPAKDIIDARVLLKLGDSVTTDHISPAGSFSKHAPAGKYLTSLHVEPLAFNSYGSRRGNHEVMVRGSFANVRIKNQMVSQEGGYTRHFPSGEELSIYDAAIKYRDDQVPLIVLGGKEYGSGSSRDWAAKGTALLGIKAVIAESFERIHRSNLVQMGVMPLCFTNGESADKLKLTGTETYSIEGIEEDLLPGKLLNVTVQGKEGKKQFRVTCRLDSTIEIEYYKHGGILQYWLRQFIKKR